MSHAYVFSSAGLNFSRELAEILSQASGDPLANFLVEQCARALREASKSAQLIMPPEFLSHCHSPCFEPLWNAAAILLKQMKVPEELVVPTAGPLLCVFQLLQVLPIIGNQASEEDIGLGCTGVCLGFLPAAAFAAARDAYEFIRFSVEMAKLSFWIALRCEQQRYDDKRPFRSHSLVVRASTDESLPTLPEGVYISTQNKSSITLSGDPFLLDQLRSNLTGRIVRPIAVYGLYHEGIRGPALVKLVERDMQREQIVFPSFSDLRYPIRSSSTGLPLSDGVPSSLAVQVLQLILSKPVQWPDVMAEYSRVAGVAQVAVVAVGPGSTFASDLSSSLLNATWSLPSATSCEIRFNEQCIAVVGMACCLPGASSPDELWDLLLEGKNMVREIPPSRFDVDMYYNPPDNPAKPNLMRTKWGNFVDEDKFGAFDHEFFTVSPREARTMDPQQRMLLQVSYHALEDAGYVPDTTITNSRETFGCFIGMVTDDYVQNIASNVDVYYSPGTLRAFTSGRVSHHFGWKGNNATYDTACASSLSAMHAAVRSLSSGESNAALVGGVHLVTGPLMYLGLDRAHFLSPTGQCKPFDADADGYCRAEGCVVVVLKRLQDADREGDRIHGIIRACEVANNAHQQSITRPDPEVQARLLAKVCSVGHVKPSEVTVVEAHAAGTQAGDPAEVRAVVDVLLGDRKSPVVMTSIKGNIGHTEPVSGLASLLKVLLMMKHRLIPSQVGLENINPRFPPFSHHLLQFPLVHRKWSEPRRLALINNFGAAGTIGTVLVEERLQTARRVTGSGIPRIITLSAKSSSALEAMKIGLAEYISGSKPDILDISVTTTQRRMRHRFRATFIAGSCNELIAELQRSKVAPEAPSSMPVIFCFSGQGAEAQVAHLGFSQSTAYCMAVSRCSEAVNRLLPVEDNSELRKLMDLFTLEYALFHMWMAWGITPLCVVGHSFGEYVAACVAEVMTLDDALRLLSERLSLMVRFGANSGGMLAVRGQLHDILARLDQFPDVEIACYNGPDNITLSGPHGQLEAVAEEIKKNKLGKSIALNVPIAFHSRAVEPIIARFQDYASTVQYGAPTLPLVSSSTGTLQSAYDAQFWADHCRNPVRFASAVSNIEDLYGKAVWLELGPKASTVNFVQGMPCLPSFKGSTTPWQGLLETVGELVNLGVNFCWDAFHADTGTGGKFVTLPCYPFSSTKLYEGYQTKAIEAQNRLSLDEGMRTHTHFGTPVLVQLDSYRDLILSHRVAGASICPATLYAEIISSTLKQPANALELKMHHPLTLKSDSTLQVLLRTQEYEFRSVDGSKLYASGRAKDLDPQLLMAQFELSFHQVAPRIAAVKRDATEVLLSRMFYAAFSRLVDYGDVFRGVRKIWIKDQEAVAIVRTDHMTATRDSSDGRIFFLAALTDSLLHSAGFLINLSEFCLPDTGFLANELHDLRISRDALMASEEYQVFVTFIFVPARAIAIADVYIMAGLSLVGICKGLEFRRMPLKVLRLITGGPVGSANRKVAVSNDAVRSLSLPTHRHQEDDFLRVVKETLQVDQVDLKSRFSDLGLDSLTMIELISSLNSSSTGHTYSSDFFLLNPTVGDALAAINENIVHPVEIAPSVASTSQSIDQFELVISILRRHLSIEELDMDVPLVALGVDSLMAIELQSEIQACFPDRQIAGDFFVSCANARACLQSLGLTKSRQSPLQRSDAGSNDSSLEPPSLLSSTGSMSGSAHLSGWVTESSSVLAAQSLIKLQDSTSPLLPLILIHDGGGSAGSYLSLPPLQRVVYGISNPGLRTGTSIKGIGTAADLYAQRIREELLSTPVLLAGWSMGGLICYELACKHPDLVKGVLLIDSPPPGLRHMSPNSVPIPKGQTTAMDKLILRQFEVNAPLIDLYSPSKVPSKLPFFIIRAAAAFETDASDAKSAEGWLAVRDDTRCDIKRWLDLLGDNIRGVFDTPGNHFELFRPPFVNPLAEKIRQALRVLEACSLSS